MRVVIIFKEEDGRKEQIGASHSEFKAQEYIEKKSLENCTLETVNVPANDNERIDNIYLAFQEKDESSFIDYFTNRFNAQQACQPDGFIRAIPIVENQHISATRPPTRTKGPAQFSKNKGTRPGIPKKDSAVEEAKALAAANASKMKVLGILVGVWVAVIYVVFSFSNKTKFEWGENKNSVKWLPEYCRNVSYFLSENIKLYEFTGDEATFKKYAQAEGLKFKELDDSMRAKTYRQYADIDWKPPEGLSNGEQWRLWKSVSQPTVDEGFKITGKDGSASRVSGLFDAETNKIYYWEKSDP